MSLYALMNVGDSKIDSSELAMIAKCWHCDNSCLVIMDDASRGFAEPCPMCAGGKMRSAEYATGIQAGGYRQNDYKNRLGNIVVQPDYYAQMDTSTLSWNHGLTTSHRFACSRFGCEYPMRVANQMCGSCLQRADQNNGVRQPMPSMREMLTIFSRADAKTVDPIERGLLIKGYLNEWKRKHKTRGVA